MCCTFNVVCTSIPASSNSRTSKYRLALSASGDIAVRQLIDDGQIWFSRQNLFDIHLCDEAPFIFNRFARNDLKGTSSSSVRCRPWVSTRATTTSRPSRRRRCASLDVINVFPTPGAAPRKIFSRPDEGRDFTHDRHPAAIALPFHAVADTWRRKRSFSAYAPLLPKAGHAYANTACNAYDINAVLGPRRLIQVNAGGANVLFLDVSSLYDGIKMQQILTILMLLVLLGSFLLLAGLVYFSEGLIRSRPES